MRLIVYFAPKCTAIRMCRADVLIGALCGGGGIGITTQENRALLWSAL